MKKWYQGDERIAEKMRELLERLCQEFGWKTRVFAALSGRYLYHSLKREETRLAQGWVYEPKAYYEKNAAALALGNNPMNRAKPLTSAVQWVTGEFSPIFAQMRTGALDTKQY